MSERNLIFVLARVLIAAAWADGEISTEEVNSLKDLLFQLPEAGLQHGMRFTGQEWSRLEMYMESPVEAEERGQLVGRLQQLLRSDRDKKLVIEMLEQLVKADGTVTESERVLVAEIRQAIDSVDVGLVAQLGRLLGGALQRRSQAVSRSASREAYFEDFVKNRVFYGIRQRAPDKHRELDLSEADLRKFSLAGGLMARVAHQDHVVTDAEYDSMVGALLEKWQVNPDAAALIAEVAIDELSADFDYYRMIRQFFRTTTQRERASFLDVLFAVADADGRVSLDEIEAIRHIARGLHLTHRQFIDAKLRIPRERRDG